MVIDEIRRQGGIITLDKLELPDHLKNPSWAQLIKQTKQAMKSFLSPSLADQVRSQMNE